MTIKEKYDFVVKNIAQAKMGSFPIYDIEVPKLFEDEKKVKEVDGIFVFNLVLTEKATEEDMKTYIDYVLGYTGQDLKFYILDENKSFKNFKK